MKKKSKIAPGTVNLTTTVPKELDEQLKELAKKSGVSRTRYTLEILKKAAKQRVRLIPQGYEFEVLTPEESNRSEIQSPAAPGGPKLREGREEPDEQRGKAR